jgi:hypothetical protein
MNNFTMYSVEIFDIYEFLQILQSQNQENQTDLKNSYADLDYQAEKRRKIP